MDEKTARYIVEIYNTGGKYSGKIFKNRLDDIAAWNVADLPIGSDALLKINDRELALSELIDRMFKYKLDDREALFKEDGQLMIGRHLFSKIFAPLPESERALLKGEGNEIRILTDDEYAAQLPWVLLADMETFLSARSTTIVLSQRMAWQKCHLSRSPRILLVMPEPFGAPPTESEAHLNMLAIMLAAENELHTLGDRLRVVTTWEDFLSEVTAFRPEIIYYYGHGEFKDHVFSLIFCARKDENPKNEDWPKKKVSSMDFKQALREIRDDLRLAYINCCSGEAAGLLGIGRQLREFIPAVITNFTFANTQAAQDQAISLFRSVLIDGKSPDRALTDLRFQVVEHGLSFRDLRWMTPVLHCAYDGWEFKPLEGGDGNNEDPHRWHKLDRVRQSNDVVGLTLKMLKHRNPKACAYLWYGARGQGVELFSERLRFELPDLIDSALLRITPRWPVEFANDLQSFEDMMTEAFDVRLDAIPSWVNRSRRPGFAKQTLLYIQHQPILLAKDDPKAIPYLTPDVIKLYLQWLDTKFIPLFKSDAPIFLLIGVSFVIGNPAKFAEHIQNQTRLTRMQFDNLAFRLLDELGCLKVEDIYQFMQTHNLNLPKDHQDTIIESIINKSEGSYEKVREMLRSALNNWLPWLTDYQVANTKPQYVDFE
jgi:hypothetical protein